MTPSVAAWVARSLPQAREAVKAPENAQWLRSGGTWFVGVNALPNDARRSWCPAARRSPARLSISFAMSWALRDLALERGQVSVCYPGYPQADAVANRRRPSLIAATAPRLISMGFMPKARRGGGFFHEPHSFLLGIPMVEASPRCVAFRHLGRLA